MSAILTAVTFVAPRALPSFSAKGVTLPNTKWLAEAYASTDIDCVHLPPEDPDFKVFSVQPSPSREILTEADVAKISRFDGFANSVRAATDDLNQVLQEVEKGNKASVLATTVFDLNNVSFTPLFLLVPPTPLLCLLFTTSLLLPGPFFRDLPALVCLAFLRRVLHSPSSHPSWPGRPYPTSQFSSRGIQDPIPPRSSVHTLEIFQGDGDHPGLRTRA